MKRQILLREGGGLVLDKANFHLGEEGVSKKRQRDLPLGFWPLPLMKFQSTNNLMNRGWKDFLRWFRIPYISYKPTYTRHGFLCLKHVYLCPVYMHKARRRPETETGSRRRRDIDDAALGSRSEKKKRGGFCLLWSWYKLLLLTG